VKLCANVSILFEDAPFLARFERAAAAGFAAVAGRRRGRDPRSATTAGSASRTTRTTATEKSLG
jgi:hydroxypyruvate isomerase